MVYYIGQLTKHARDTREREAAEAAAKAKADSLVEAEAARDRLRPLSSTLANRAVWSERVDETSG